MGKQRRRALPAAVALALLSLSGASRADWHFAPQFEVRETYTDNVALRADGQANWVTELAPGFTLENRGPRLQVRAAYTKRFYEYADKDIGGTNGDTQQLNADAKARLLGQSLFLDASANISQRAESAFGPLLTNGGNGFASANASEVKVLRASPYLVHRFGNLATAELRFSLDRMSTDSVGLGDTDGKTTTLNLQSGTAMRQLGWGVFASHAQQDNSVAGKSADDNLNLNLRYQLRPTLTLTAGGGYDRYDYDALGGNNGGRAWSMGFTWEPSARTRVAATAGRRYYGDSYTLQAEHRSRTTVWTLNYSDAVTTTRSQFLLPSAVNTATLLDGLFAASIADPVARRQAVDAYILATGLPASLANTVNYFSNRYMLQRQLQAAAAFNTARSTLILTLASARREGLSSSQVDGGLLGSSTSTLNDNTRQDGASAVWNWRWGGRTSANFAADYARVQSLSQNRTDHHSTLRLVLTRALQPSLNGYLELRRVRGGVSPADYSENAIAASLTKKF